MDYIISHISAFEYWRHVGQCGVITPAGISRAAIPRALPREAQINNVAQNLSLPLHILSCEKHKHRPSSSIASHQATAPLPAGSIRKLSRRIGITSPELTLAHISSLLTLPELVALMCEFCGGFSIHDDLPHGMFSREALTSTKKLRAFAGAAHGIGGIDSFRCAARYALDGSRSPAETAAGLMLTLPRMRGGYGLRGAVLNPVIPLRARAREIAGVPSLKPDIMWPDARVCIEYDSKEFHCDEKRIANDARRKNALLLSDFHVITLTSAQLSNRQEMNKIAKHVAKSTGKRWNPPDFQKQVKLRNEVLGAASTLRRSQELLARSGQSPRGAAADGAKRVRH